MVCENYWNLELWELSSEWECFMIVLGNFLFSFASSVKQTCGPLIRTALPR